MQEQVWCGSAACFADGPHVHRALKKYDVSVYRQFQDVLKAHVEVEAENELEAVAKAKEIVANADFIEFDFHACGEYVGDDDFDAVAL